MRTAESHVAERDDSLRDLELSCSYKEQGFSGPGSDTKDDIVYAQIDLDKVAEARRNLTYLWDRRPDAYPALLGMSSDQRQVVVPKELAERKERPELFAR